MAFHHPRFEATHRVVRFDHVGAGGAEPAAFDTARHAGTGPVIFFVGQSVSAMFGVLAARERWCAEMPWLTE